MPELQNQSEASAKSPNLRSILIAGGLGRGSGLYAGMKKQLRALAAHDMKGLHFDLQFLDLSDQFPWGKEFWQGPCPELTPNADSSILASSYSIMTKHGPIELANKDQRAKTVKLFPWLIDYLGNWSKTEEHGSDQFLKTEGEKLRFAKHWTQPVGRLAEASASEELADPIRPDLIRPETVRPDSLRPETIRRRVEDVALRGRDHVSGLILAGDRSDYHSLDQMVWCFSDRETHFLSKNLSEKLFSKQTSPPIYSWVVYHVEFDGRPNLPHEFLWVEEPTLHWSRGNALTFRRVSTPPSLKVPTSPDKVWYQVWLRLPEVFRFSNSDLISEMRMIEDLLRKNPVTGSSKFTVHLPQEAQSDSSALGPSLFAKLDPGGARSSTSAKNVHLVHWDLVQSFLWEDLRNLQALIELRLIKWCNDETQTHLKNVAKLEAKKK